MDPRVRRRAGRLVILDINLAWAIATFFLGAILNRLNESSRHARDVLAAREQAFEAMQRDTWVGTQDALAELWEASSSFVLAQRAHETALERWAASMAIVRAESAPDPDPAYYAAASKYFGSRQRAAALASRLDDESVRVVVEGAIHNIADYQANWTKKDKPHGVSRWSMATSANEVAVKQLGALIRNPPHRPDGQPSWRHRLGHVRTTVSNWRPWGRTDNR